MYLRLNLGLNCFSLRDSSKNFHNWVPNFNGIDSYGVLTNAFTPTGSGTEIALYGLYEPSGATQQLLAPDLSAFSITVNASNILSFNLITNVQVNGIDATSGVTELEGGYFIITGDLDSSADIKVIGSNAALGDNFQAQAHQLEIVDTLDSENSLDIDLRIFDKFMPSDTDILNKNTGLTIGSLNNLKPIQPYVPLLKGGEVNRSFVVDKFEFYLGVSRITPASLFQSGQGGMWYDPRDLDTLYEDVKYPAKVFEGGIQGMWYNPRDLDTLYAKYPDKIFEGGVQGMWYDPSDLDTLYKESNPV